RPIRSSGSETLLPAGSSSTRCRAGTGSMPTTRTRSWHCSPSGCRNDPPFAGAAVEILRWALQARTRARLLHRGRVVHGAPSQCLIGRIMCGIVGYIGERTAAPLLIEGLRRLEYRGYDSAGISVLEDGKLDVRKSVGKIAELEKRLANGSQPNGTIGIAHTRWATHGAPTEVN